MRARLSLVCVLGFLAVLILQGCAARAAGTDTAANPPVPAGDTLQPADTAAPQPPEELFEPSAPNEIVSEGVKSQRRFVVEDMRRAKVASSVEQGPPGILRVGVGESFHTLGAREFYFSKLASAYYTWAVEGQPLVVELWEDGAKIGEYSRGAFLMGASYSTPRGCPENATTGLCATLGRGPQRVAIPTQADTATGAPGQEPATGIDRHAGFHVGFGLGAGSADRTCTGCDFESKAGMAGILTLGHSVVRNTVLGVEATGWTRSESVTSAQVYSLVAHATRYLSANSGLFLRAGVGLVGYREDSEARDGDLTASGPGFSGRVGYEFGEGRFVVTPYVGLVRTFGGADFKVDGEDIGFNAAIANLQAGLSIGLR
jgi:hypothetical protein